MPITHIILIAQTVPPPAPWPGPLTYVGIALLLFAAYLTVRHRMRKRDDDPPEDES